MNKQIIFSVLFDKYSTYWLDWRYRKLLFNSRLVYNKNIEEYVITKINKYEKT